MVTESSQEAPRIFFRVYCSFNSLREDILLIYYSLCKIISSCICVKSMFAYVLWVSSYVALLILLCMCSLYIYVTFQIIVYTCSSDWAIYWIIKIVVIVGKPTKKKQIPSREKLPWKITKINSQRLSSMVALKSLVIPIAPTRRHPFLLRITSWLLPFTNNCER